MNSRFRKTFLLLSITLIHLFLFALPSFKPQKPTPPKKTIFVKTTYMKEEKKISTSTSYAVRTTNKPIATTKKKKAPSKKKAPQHSSKKTIKNTKNAKAKKLLQQLDKNLQELDTHSASSLKATPPKPLLFSSTRNQDQQTIELSHQFIEYLQEKLQLPDPDEIKVSISVQPNGKVDNIQIISSTSERNAQYMQEQLPHILFEGFTQQIDLTIIFRGDHL